MGQNTKEQLDGTHDFTAAAKEENRIVTDLAKGAQIGRDQAFDLDDLKNVDDQLGTMVIMEVVPTIR